jgi:hypothetical protein
MSSSEDHKNDMQSVEFEKHRSRFFALIGYCVISYQTVEDYLPDVFAAALGINEAKALKIFNHVRGLETKLAMISEALSDVADEHQLRWQTLLKHIREAADSRNQIAHANPVHNGGRVIIELGDGCQVKSVKRTESERMELHKQAQNSKVIWTTELLIAEQDRVTKLFRHLIAFVKRLKGESVPEHLEEAFDPAPPKGKKTKQSRQQH